MDTQGLRSFTLAARERLTREAQGQLLQLYGLREDSSFLEAGLIPVLGRSSEARETRARLERLLCDEADAGVAATETYAKLVKETAFTHLNRLVAFKLMEARGLIAESVSRYQDSDGFRRFCAESDGEAELYERGSLPVDDRGEGPRDQAYRHFLLHRAAELAREVRVLFDVDDLPSRLFPRPPALKAQLEGMNAEELAECWAAGNEETIGWVYQYFNEPDLEQFAGQSNRKVPPELVGPRTQNFTPRWIVRFLVENTLGRLWIGMHPDSSIREKLSYYVAPPGGRENDAVRSISSVTFLDPAAGTMHFGLVAFDLYMQMYLEEMERAGQAGWPPDRPVRSADEIPAAILRNNLFGIDVDLRAVQLGALALYLRCKAMRGAGVMPEPNLACADVTDLAPGVVDSLLGGGAQAVVGRVLRAVLGLLRGSNQFGSLLRIEREVGALLESEKAAWKADLEMFPDLGRFGDGAHAGEEFWVGVRGEIERRLGAAIGEHGRSGGSLFFAEQASRGVHLLDLLVRRYDIVATNPPYLDSRDQNAALRSFLGSNYKGASKNLYTAMLRRCFELAAPGGQVGMVSGQSFMFTGSFESLREECLQGSVVEGVLQFGYGLFKARVDTAAFVLRRVEFAQEAQEGVGVYFRLVKEPDAEAKRAGFEEALERRRQGLEDARVFEYRQRDFGAIPGSPWVYWITPSLRELFRGLPGLRSLASPRHGMSTGDNLRFLRFWWEVGLRLVGRARMGVEGAASPCERWYPYMKGGAFRRWLGNQAHVVGFGREGRELRAAKEDGTAPGHRYDNADFYFRRGVTYSYVTAGAFSARLSPGGFIFDVAGSSLFPEDVELVLGVLNSSFAQYALKLINPTVNHQVGDLARLPMPRRGSGRLRELVNEAVELAQADSAADETTYDFVAPLPWPDGAEVLGRRQQRLAEVERAIDEEVYRLYGISDEDRAVIAAELAAPGLGGEEDAGGGEGEEDGDAGRDEAITQERLAQAWVSYAVGIALGRFSPGEAGAIGRGAFAAETAGRLRSLAEPSGLMVVEEHHPHDLAQRVLEVLTVMQGEAGATRIVRAATDTNVAPRAALAAYLTGGFFKAHVKQYRKRPVYWLVQSPERSFSAFLFHERASGDTLARLQSQRYLGGRIYEVDRKIAEASAVAARGGGGARAAAGRQARALAEELDDLKRFDALIQKANQVSIRDQNGRPSVARWVPELDDGVLLNAAPLHELLPGWRRADAKLDPKKAWKELEAGEYDWAKTAMRYWPQRVLAACRENQSYAIAHGLA